MDVAPQAVLQWDRGALEAECDRAAVVQAGVEAYLGRIVFAADGAALIRVSLRKVEELGRMRLIARVEQQDEHGQKWGERTVSGGESCDSLDEQLTLVVALMVDHPSERTRPPASDKPPEAPSPSSPPESAPPDESDDSDADAAAATAEIPTAPSLEHATATRPHATLLGVGLVSMGALPATGVGAGLVARVKPRGFWGLGLQLGALAPNAKVSPPDGSKPLSCC